MVIVVGGAGGGGRGREDRSRNVGRECTERIEPTVCSSNWNLIDDIAESDLCGGGRLDGYPRECTQSHEEGNWSHRVTGPGGG